MVCRKKKINMKGKTFFTPAFRLYNEDVVDLFQHRHSNVKTNNQKMGLRANNLQFPVFGIGI